MKDASAAQRKPSKTEEELATHHEETRSAIRKQWEKRKRLIPLLTRWNNIAFFTSMAGLLMMIVEMEISRHVYANKPNLPNVVIKSVQSVTTIFLLYAVHRYWVIKVEIFKAKELVHQTATPWNIPKYRRTLILELLVCLIHVPPMVDLSIGYLYKDLHANSLGCLMFARLYMVPRMMKQSFKRNYISHKVRLIGAINRVPFNWMFVLKAMLTLRPYIVLLSTLVGYVLVSAYCYTVFEINIDVCGEPDADENNCHPPAFYYWRWVVFAFALILGIEPKTVPLSLIGQIITIFGAMVGTCLLAILIAVIAQSLTLSTTESRVVDQIRTRILTKATKDRAIRFIQNYWRWLVALRRNLSKNGSGASVKEIGALSATRQDNITLSSKERRVKEQLVYAIHEWKVTKRKGKRESQLTSLSKDVSTIIDEVSHVKEWCNTTIERVQTLTVRTDEHLDAIAKRIDDLTFAVTGKRAPVSMSEETKMS